MAHLRLDYHRHSCETCDQSLEVTKNSFITISFQELVLHQSDFAVGRTRVLIIMQYRSVSSDQIGTLHIPKNISNIKLR